MTTDEPILAALEEADFVSRFARTRARRVEQILESLNQQGFEIVHKSWEAARRHRFSNNPDYATKGYGEAIMDEAIASAGLAEDGDK